MNRLIFLGGLVFSLSAPGYAWWSKSPVSTHDIISNQAILIVDRNAYPDIIKFSNTIVGATTTPENDALAHGNEDRDDAGKFNGGDFNRWWDTAKAFYEDSKFNGDKEAYFRVGSMAHLLEDQAVPAHADNIYHGQQVGDISLLSWIPIFRDIPTDADELEKYAAWVGLMGNLRIDQNVPTILDENPVTYYVWTRA